MHYIDVVEYGEFPHTLQKTLQKKIIWVTVRGFKINYVFMYRIKPATRSLSEWKEVVVLFAKFASWSFYSLEDSVIYIKSNELKMYAWRAETNTSKSINKIKTGVIRVVKDKDETAKKENM